MGTWLQTIIHNHGGLNIYRDCVILENLKNHNYEAKKVKERLRHNKRKNEQIKSN